jgi:hypothetical protein
MNKSYALVDVIASLISTVAGRQTASSDLVSIDGVCLFSFTTIVSLEVQAFAMSVTVTLYVAGQGLADASDPRNHR